jgi:thiol-disulfide isomerase/thioredoxin
MSVRVGPSALSRVESGFETERWVNSPPLTTEALRGQVVLLDFWEYTCVNWIRTAPYLKAWHRDYAPLGLVVIGVHAPEFEFGEHAEHIDLGIRDHGLTYPIVVDNDFTIWQAVGNHAWPAKYLYDAYGNLVDQWIGEGSYSHVEAEIRRLLADTGTVLPAVSPEATAFNRTGEPSYARITAETYVGAERGEPGTVSLTGDWRSSRQYVELQSGTGTIDLSVHRW